MGGHLAIRDVQEYGVDPRLLGMVLTAPMIKIKTRAYPWAIARAISWTMNKLGQSESFVIGYKPFNPERCEFKSSEYGAKDYFEKNCRILAAHPELAVGGPSFGWLEASFHSADQLEDPEKIAHITVPILIISALLDHRVENSAQKTLCQQLPQCRLIDYESRHNIWGESQNLRTQFWRDFESFLAHIEDSSSSNNARGG
jgi:lysophospholipase